MNTSNLLENCLDTLCERSSNYPRDAVSIVRAAKLIAKKAHDRANEILVNWDITYPEYSVLTMLYGSENFTLTPSELSQVVGEKSANITRLTNQLVSKALIERSGRDDDRRKIAVKLTDKGIHLLEEAMPAISDRTVGICEGMSPEMRQKLDKLQLAFLDLFEK